MLLPSTHQKASGQLTITPSQLIFEPNLDEVLIALGGVSKYTIVLDMGKIVEAKMGKPPGLSLASDLVVLQVVTSEDHSVAISKTFFFAAQEHRIKEVMLQLEGRVSTRREAALMQSLGLDATPRQTSRRNLLAGTNTPPKLRPVDDLISSSPSHLRRLSRGDLTGVSSSPRTPLRDRTTQSPPDQPDGPNGQVLSGLGGFETVAQRGARALSLASNFKDIQANLLKTLAALPADEFDDKKVSTAATISTVPPPPAHKAVSTPSHPDRPEGTSDAHVVPEDDDTLGHMLDKSFVLDHEAFLEVREPSFPLIPTHPDQLRAMLPPLMQDKHWRRLFTTQLDGISYNTFFSKVADSGPNLVLIKDTAGYVFGGYATEEWQLNGSFTGTGECFVFALKPKVACYRWTGANEFFQIATREHFGMGGGYCPSSDFRSHQSLLARQAATPSMLTRSSLGARARCQTPFSTAVSLAALNFNVLWSRCGPSPTRTQTRTDALLLILRD